MQTVFTEYRTSCYIILYHTISYIIPYSISYHTISYSYHTSYHTSYPLLIHHTIPYYIIHHTISYHIIWRQYKVYAPHDRGASTQHTAVQATGVSYGFLHLEIDGKSSSPSLAVQVASCERLLKSSVLLVNCSLFYNQDIIKPQESIPT